MSRWARRALTSGSPEGGNEMTKTRIAAIIAAATLGAGAFTGAAVALAADDTPSPSAGKSAQSRDRDGHGPPQDGPVGTGPREGHGPRGGHGPSEHGSHGPDSHGPRGGMLHSEGVIEDADGTFVTVRMQQGEVTSASATSITVTSADGYTSTYSIGDSTVVERDGEDAPPEVGDTVHVRGAVTGGTATADMVHALSPDAAREFERHRDAMEDGMSERAPEPGGPWGPGRA